MECEFNLKYWEAGYLTEEQVEYVIDDKERKLGGEQSEEPLWGIHVSSEAEIHKVIKQIR